MATKLYLGKTKDIIKDDLRQLVVKYGLVKNFEDKESYCFVDYYYESDARIAQVELDGQILSGCKLVAQFSKASVKQDDISKEALPSQAKRVYVGNLNHKFTHQELLELFSKVGQINELINKETYALIEFSSQQSATQAILTFNETVLKGETLKVDMQKSYDEVLCSTNRIFIGKLNPNITKQDLIFNFGQFGFIEDITLKDEHYGFIQYKNILQASKAIKEMNGAIIKDQKILVQEARCMNYSQIAKGNIHHVQQHPGMVNLLPHQVPFPAQKQRGIKNFVFKTQPAPAPRPQFSAPVFLPEDSIPTGDLRPRSKSRSRSKSKN